MATKKAGQKPIHLDFRSEQQVVVIPDDKDRFITTAAEAARACKSAENDSDWNRQWNDFLAHIHAWCKEHSSVVLAGYVSVGDSALNVLICTVDEEYNFDFEDTISDLDIDLANRFPLVSSEVMQIPNQAGLTSELPDEALFVYGDGQRTPAAGPA